MRDLGGEPTSTIASDAVDLFGHATLVETPFALLANPAVSPVPWTSNLIAYLPFLLSRTDCDDLANDFVAGYSWTAICQYVLLIDKNSWPHNGVPKICCCTTTSEWQTPQAKTLIRTWSSDGCFVSTSSMTNGPPFSLNKAALWVLGIWGAISIDVRMVSTEGRFFRRASRDIKQATYRERRCIRSL